MLAEPPPVLSEDGEAVEAPNDATPTTDRAERVVPDDAASGPTDTTTEATSDPDATPENLAFTEDDAPAASEPDAQSEDEPAFIQARARTWSVSVPSDWLIIERKEEIKEKIKETEERGVVWYGSPQKAFEQDFNGDSVVIAFSERGDFMVAERRFGQANELLDPKEFEYDFEDRIDGAEEIDLTSENRRFGDRAGVLVRGSYIVDEDDFTPTYVYEFTVYQDAHLYAVYLSLFDEDVALATEIFRSIQILN